MCDLNQSNRGLTNITECTGTVDDTITQRRYSQYQSVLTTRDRLTRHAVPRSTILKQNAFEKLPPAIRNRPRLISEYRPREEEETKNVETVKTDEIYYQIST